MPIDLVDYGKALEYTALKTALTEMQPYLAFDLPTQLPDTWSFALQGGYAEEMAKKYVGVYWGPTGQLLTQMDRGTIPEFKVWEIVEGPVEIPADRVTEIPMAWSTWKEVPPGDPAYADGLVHAQHGDHGFSVEISSKTSQPHLRHYRGFVMGKVRGKVLKLGWRHTLEGLLRHNLPGLSRSAVATKLNVDLLRVPMGDIQELRSALIEV